MARVHRIQKSNKAHTCGKGHEIPKGDPYLWAKPGFRRRTPLVRCVKHPFRPSELMTGAASAPTAAVESFEDAVAAGFNSMEDLEAAWDELRDAVEEYHQDRETALEAWEYGNSQLEEYVETAAAALEEIEGHTFESFDDEEPSADDEDDWEEWDQARIAHTEQQADDALSIAGGLEF